MSLPEVVLTAVKHLIDNGGDFSNTPRPPATVWKPRYDLIRTQTSTTIYVELPGVRTESVEVTVEEKVITVSGSRSPPYSENPESRGILYGEFSVRIPLPIILDPRDSIQMDYKDGILQILAHPIPGPPPRKYRLPQHTVDLKDVQIGRHGNALDGIFPN